jgi:hypothetical protein
MRKAFSLNDTAGDLLNWAGQIEALGTAIYYLANDDDQGLEFCAEGLGRIVSDYGKLIHAVVGENYSRLSGWFTPLSDTIKEGLKEIQLAENPREALIEISGYLEKIGEYTNDLSLIVNLKEELTKLREQIYEKQRTSAKHDGQAEAQSVDLKRSEGQSKIA